MKTKDKIDRIVARNPELKETFISLGDESIRAVLSKMVEKNLKKVVIIGKEAEKYARLYEVSMIMNMTYPHITELTTLTMLDMLVNRDSEDGNDLPSLTSVVDDVVIIHDSRAYMPNRQKSNMIMQVFEQNEHCIYYYVGTHKSFLQEHQALIDYCKENNIPKVNTESNKTVYSPKEEEI